MTVRFRSKNIADLTLIVGLVASLASVAGAQQAPATPPAPTPAARTPSGAGAAAKAAATAVPVDYVIGPEDVLSVVYWRDKDMTGDVSVRPDGKISLPLLNDVQAAGLTPAQLRDRLVEVSKQYFEDPSVTVVVKQMNSHKAFITGEMSKPRPYPLVGPTTGLQLISLAGGLRGYAH